MTDEPEGTVVARPRLRRAERIGRPARVADTEGKHDCERSRADQNGTEGSDRDRARQRRDALSARLGAPAKLELRGEALVVGSDGGVFSYHAPLFGAD